MSKFNVYSTKGGSIASVGKRSRRLALILVFFGPFYYIIINPIILINRSEPLIYFILGLFGITLITLLIMNYKNSKKLIKTGEIQFNQSGAINTVDEKEDNWNFEKLEKIILKTHMKSVNNYNNIENIKTYILTANFNDSKTQQLIIGNQSTDKFEKSLKEILNILSRKNKFELEIK